MSHEEYAENLAEAYESGGSRLSGAGGSRPKAKKRAKPTTVGIRHEGGRAWGTTEKRCAKGCSKRCCSMGNLVKI